MTLEIRDIRCFSDEFYRTALLDLPDVRRRHIAHLASADDRRRSLLGEQTARELLAAHLGIPAQEVRIRRSENGKPLAEGAFFSVAHSGRLVACAVDDAPVGVDLERLRPVDPRLAAMLLTEEETEVWRALPPAEGERFLLSQWVLKESWVKCTDASSLRMREVSFSLGADGGAVCSDARFACRLFQPQPGFILALCSLRAGGAGEALQF